MPLFIECSSGHRLKVPGKFAGLRIVCPVCNEAITVPGEKQNQPRTKEDAALDVPSVRPPETRTREEDHPPGAHVADDDTAIDPPLEEPTERPEPIESPRPLPAVSKLTEETSTDVNVDDQWMAGPRDVEVARPQPTVTLGNTGPALPFDEANLPVDQEPSWQTDSFVIVDSDDHLRKKASQPSLRDQHRSGVLVLGVTSVLIAIGCAVPSLVEQMQARQETAGPPDLWTWLVQLGSVIQIGIAIYAMQLPDWSTSWISSVVATLLAATYALGLALTMYASQEHSLVASLGLVDEAFRGRAQPWCFAVMCVTLLLAYFYGRFSVRWYQAYQRQFAV